MDWSEDHFLRTKGFEAADLAREFRIVRKIFQTTFESYRRLPSTTDYFFSEHSWQVQGVFRIPDTADNAETAGENLRASERWHGH